MASGKLTYFCLKFDNLPRTCVPFPWPEHPGCTWDHSFRATALTWDFQSWVGCRRTGVEQWAALRCAGGPLGRDGLPFPLTLPAKVGGELQNSCRAGAEVGMRLRLCKLEGVLSPRWPSLPGDCSWKTKAQSGSCSHRPGWTIRW